MNFHGFEFEVISADKLDTYPNFNKAKHYSENNIKITVNKRSTTLKFSLPIKGVTLSGFRDVINTSTELHHSLDIICAFLAGEWEYCVEKGGVLSGYAWPSVKVTSSKIDKPSWVLGQKLYPMSEYLIPEAITQDLIKSEPNEIKAFKNLCESLTAIDCDCELAMPKNLSKKYSFTFHQSNNELSVSEWDVYHQNTYSGGFEVNSVDEAFKLVEVFENGLWEYLRQNYVENSPSLMEIAVKYHVSEQHSLFLCLSPLPEYFGYWLKPSVYPESTNHDISGTVDADSHHLGNISLSEAISYAENLPNKAQQPTFNVLKWNVIKELLKPNSQWSMKEHDTELFWSGSTLSVQFAALNQYGDYKSIEPSPDFDNRLSSMWEQHSGYFKEDTLEV